MKICMIVPQADVKGGIATVVNGYREYGFGEGYEVDFVESYRDGSKWAKLRKAISSYVKFVEKLLFQKPDVVHIHSSFGPSFYRKIPFIYMANWRGVKVINHIHGAEFDVFYEKASEKKRKLIQRVYDRCDIIIVLSLEWKERITQIVNPEKIEVIENYCHIPEMKAEVRKKQILFLGELGKRKGCFDIPLVYKKVIETVGDIPLIMAGDGEMESIKNAFQENGISQRVSFPGWVRGEEKEKMLQESTYFLFPSYNEGMPMAVLEAMAYGMGIVTSNVGGIPKLIDNGVSGYLCTPGDVKDISSKLISLILNHDLSSSCGNNARKKAIEEYSFESHRKKIIEVYRKL